MKCSLLFIILKRNEKEVTFIPQEPPVIIKTNSVKAYMCSIGVLMSVHNFPSKNKTNKKTKMLDYATATDHIVKGPAIEKNKK